MAQGSGVFNAQFSGVMKRRRRRAGAEDARAEAELRKWIEQALGYQQPYYDYGENALSRFRDWERDPNAITSDPSYKWRVGQGSEALENSAAARGGLLSGNTGQALVRFGQEEGSKEYGNEFNRWMEKLGIGQRAAANMSNISTGAGNSLSGLIGRNAENNWRRVMDQFETTRKGELATNSIVQDWVPAMYGGGGTSSPQGAGGGGGGGQSWGGGAGSSYDSYANQDSPFSQWSGSGNWGSF